MTKLLIPINERICFSCGSKTTQVVKIKNKYHPYWGNVDNKPYCRECVYKLKYRPREKGRRIRFKNLHPLLDENPRKGICEWCDKKKGDEFINAHGKKSIVKCTHMHHIDYHDTDILKDVVELCPSCHMKETMRIKKLNKLHGYFIKKSLRINPC